MNCRKCGSRVSADLHYCGTCGAEIPVVCTNCSFENSPADAICRSCGRLLGQQRAVSDADQSGHRFSRLVADKIFESKRALEGEKKLVTVLFADVADYGEMSGKLQPEQIFEVLDHCFELMADRVLFYGGTVGQLAGKGFLAVFGAPLAYEDHAQRACRAALAIQQQMEELGREIHDRFGIRFQMLLGLNSGHILVGSVEDDLTMDYSDIGNTSNIAFKVKCAAEPGTAFLSENTYKLTEGFFIFGESGRSMPVAVPPLKLYKLVAESPYKTAFDVRAKRGLTPFVDRDVELKRLKDSYELAAQGNPLSLAIVAESGIGKSRLLHEFRKSVVDSKARYLELKCLSHSRGVAYHPFIDFLKNSFNILDTDDNDQIRLKVKSGLKPVLVDDSTTLPFLLELLSVRESGIDSIPINPDSRKYHIMEALKRLILWESRMGPLVFALEDVHWSDRSSEEFINYLMGMTSGAKIFMILTYRPELAAQSVSISCLDKLRLEPFYEDESIEMIHKLLGPSEVDPELQDLILKKTEGVPFFIEEFLRSTKDLKIIELRDEKYRLAENVGDVAIPSTVNDAIMARVDSLPETAKAVLQAASAIEREFSYALIKKVTGLSDEELHACFALLQEADLVHCTAADQELKYAFRHALTREVVYDAVVVAGKRALHAKIGAAIEELYSAKLTEYYGILVNHFLIGRNYERAAEYAKLASKKARKTASFNDAIEYAKKRVYCLENLPLDKKVQSELIDARTSIGLYYTQMNNHVEAKKAVEPIIDSATRRGEDKKLAQIYTVLGTHYCFVDEDFSEGLKKLQESIRIAEQANDILSSVSGYGWMGIALSANGEFSRALEFLEKALEINQALGTLWGESMVKSLMSSLVYNFSGDLEHGMRFSEDALRLAEESGDPLSKGMAYASLGMTNYYTGRLEEAENYLTWAATLLDKANYYYWEAWVSYLLGATCLDLKRYEEAADHHRRSIFVFNSAQIMPSCQRLNELALALVEARAGAKDLDIEKLNSCFSENRFALLRGWMARLIADVLLTMDERRWSEAENWIRTAVVADNANSMKLHLGRDYAMYGRVCRLTKRKGEAESYLTKAMQIFRFCGAEGDLNKLAESGLV